MTALIELLFVVCRMLLVPVIAALLVFLGWTAVLLGGFLRECLLRSRARKTLDRCLAEAKHGGDRRQLWKLLQNCRHDVPAAFYARTGSDINRAEVLSHAVVELEHAMTEAMARLSLLIRVGPMLGLMGTLIPLGPALRGLASGDIQMMAQNLVVAFTTTIIGVLIGSMAYGISLARRVWYGRDLCDLEFICQRLAEDTIK